jgi:hypothetical protein
MLFLLPWTPSWKMLISVIFYLNSMRNLFRGKTLDTVALIALWQYSVEAFPGLIRQKILEVWLCSAAPLQLSGTWPTVTEILYFYTTTVAIYTFLTVRTQQRLYGTWTVFQKNYEILGGKVRNIISKTLFLLNFTDHIS